MSTRARIGVIRQQGTTESVYVHSDGYPDAPCGVGATLLQHWTNPEDVDALLALGDLSILGDEIGEDQGPGWFDDRFRQWAEIDRDDPRLKWCLAYRRDRGERDVDAIVHPSDDWPDFDQDYEYALGLDGVWRVRWVRSHGKGDWLPLQEVVEGGVEEGEAA